MLNADTIKSVLYEIFPIPSDTNDYYFLVEVSEIICNRLDLYFVGFYLIDDAHEWLNFFAGNGNIGYHLRHRNHRLSLDAEQSEDPAWRGYAIHFNKLLRLDYEKREVHAWSLPYEPLTTFNAPLIPSEFHGRIAPGVFLDPIPTVSGLCVFPLRAYGKIIGIVEVYNNRIWRFGADDLLNLQVLVNHIARQMWNSHYGLGDSGGGLATV